MPRGVPNAGYRAKPNNTAKRLAALKVEYKPVVKETDEQIEARLAERFEILDVLAEACTVGNARALIVSGPAGLGKSFTIERRLKEWDPSELSHTIVKGYVRSTGLFKLLYKHREEGQVIVFDDADAIFFDDTALNLLKAVCDTTEERRVSWLTEAVLIDEDSATRIPSTFTFNGTIIFISNYDFDAMIEKGHKLAPHLSALVSRSHYIDTSMKTRRDYLIRIKQVIKQGLLSDLTDEQKSDVMSFIDENNEKLRELSLRMAIKLGNLRKTNDNWERIARITCCK